MQVGSYTVEEAIIRVEDVYGRELRLRLQRPMTAIYNCRSLAPLPTSCPRAHHACRDFAVAVWMQCLYGLAPRASLLHMSQQLNSP